MCALAQTSSGAAVSFDAQLGNARPALQIVGNNVFLSWASHCDHGYYHGWVRL